MARTKGSKFKKQLNKLTFGLFDTVVDICLFTAFLHSQSIAMAYGKKDIIEAIKDAIKNTKIIHANSLKRNIYRATQKGYLEKKEDFWKITKLGQERLERVMPRYEQDRPWDGILYLITYDIPEEKRRERNYLRDFLKKLGCGMLQESVWLTTYNPKKIVVDYLKEKNLVGLVLVSELKEGSGIGGKEMIDVLDKVYKLNEINDQYREFTKAAEAKKLKGMPLIITYLSILKKDPQLPFELLTDGWWGEDAYEIYKSELISMRPHPN